MPTLPAAVRNALDRGVAIPAMPLALTPERRLDERRQRALIRYYAASGAGGLAVGVHTTQFAIRDPRHGLFEPVLALAAEELGRADRERAAPTIRIAGICGGTRQAVAEAGLARDHGYHAGLLSLAALTDADEDALIAHCRAVAEVIPLVGFYLQPSVGGRVLPYRFWRGFAEIEGVVAMKIAPFNRYQTLDVVRAVAEAGRDDIALYTGNDDAIVHDLVTPYRIETARGPVERRIVGGLLGHWSVWTSRAVELLAECQAAARSGDRPVGAPPHGRPGHRRQRRLLRRRPRLRRLHRRPARGPPPPGAARGDVVPRPGRGPSPGQAEEIDRVYRRIPS